MLNKKRIIMTSGLALFAMFFGAGNIIYPLTLGAHSGTQVGYVLFAFLISGIGLPFLGLFATSLYEGDYWEFFSRLGKIPAFLLITFLILIIGPLFAVPRTETVTFHTLQPFLPKHLNNPYLFSGIYCFILFLLSYRHNKIVDIIGHVLSPIKLILFTVLIFFGLLSAHPILPNDISALSSIKMGLENGYSTMDLLATFFFCSVICRYILYKTKEENITDIRIVIKIFLQSCFVGGVILGIVYVGFMLIALLHASELQGVETAQMIIAVSKVILGQYGSFFIGICVSFACIVTAVALTEVSSSFFYEHVLLMKVPRIICLIFTIIIIYMMSVLGFATIMKIASPILQVLYPALIIYCVINIYFKLSELKNRNF